MKTEFKVNDTVRITGKKGNHGFDIGDTCAITVSVDEDGYYGVKRGNEFYWVKEFDMKLSNHTLIPNDLIISAHKEACVKWKGIIEKACPELFKPKFKVGDWIFIDDGGGHNANHKWYKYENGVKKGQVHRIDDIDLSQCQKIDNVVSVNGTAYRVEYIKRLATPSEVESHLKKASEEKGFKVGVKIENTTGIIGVIGKEFSQIEETRYMAHKDLLIYMGAYVYKQGKWATIIPSELTLEERVAKLEKMIK